MANQFVAFMDERHGLGAWVAEQIAADLFRNPAGKDNRSYAAKKGGGEAGQDLSGRPVSSADLSLSLHGSGTRRSFGAPGAAASAASPAPRAYKTWTSPRSSAEATAAAVVSGQAQVGVLPLYEEGGGFNKDTLSALLDFPQTVLGEYVAESNYVLAVPTDLLHEVDQSGFTDSFDATGSKGFAWTAEKQRKYRGRIGTVYASADALRHCAAAVEGLRAKGVDVQLVPDGVDVYREGLLRAHELLDPNREVQTTYGPNGQSRTSKTKGANHGKPLIGVLLSFDKALGDGGYSFDSDYKVLEAEMAGADRVRTSFVATAAAPKSGKVVLDPVTADLSALDRFFNPPKHQRISGEQGPLRRTPGLAGRAEGLEPAAGPYPYARMLYAVPTVGEGVRDHSPVLARLTEAGLSYRTVSLDHRDGMPAVIAVDVPSGYQGRVRPVIKAIHRLPGAQRIAVFPSVTPMVDQSLLPRPAVSPKTRLLLQGAAVIALAVGAYVVVSLRGIS